MRNITIVLGLGYGDEGKGSIVDYLATKTDSSLVVRFNGGAQAAHNVISADGIHHTFSQFGSGMFHPGSATYLSKYMLVNPLNLFTEGNHLIEHGGVTDAWDRLFIDERAKIITPWHVIANRAREESRGAGRHGSCGQGVGETVSDSLKGIYITIEDLKKSPEEIKEKLQEIANLKKAQLASELRYDMPEHALDEAYVNKIVSLYMTLPETTHIVNDEEAGELFSKPEQVIFEGAQGVLLDELYGWHPHTTWSNTTKYNAEQIILDYAIDGDKVTTLGVTRAYATRHGAGPFPTENGQTGGVEAHNKRDSWQGDFRIGAFDAITFDYALRASGGVDELAVTCLDQIGLDQQYICTNYLHPGSNTYITRLQFHENTSLSRQENIGKLLYECEPFYEVLEGPEQLLFVLHNFAPVTIVSAGPTAEEKVVGIQSGALV